MIARAKRTRAALGALAMLLACPLACLRTTETRFYTLNAEKAPEQPVPRAVRYTVRVAPVAVPEALDRPELVLRRSATELAIDESHRWAEPLRTGIARAVAGDLGRELDGATVSASDDESAHEPSDVVVTIALQDLDVRLAEGAAVAVAWTARWSGEGPTRRGRSFARAPSAPGGGYDGAVAACAAALGAVSRDIAQALRADHLSRR
jgi:uncharacterized lipoprotein YmbA